MKYSLYLHIGSEKTGSASLHKFLANNRSALGREGLTYFSENKVFYSQASSAHSPIVASFFPEPPDFIKPSAHVPSQDMLPRLEEALSQESRNIIISSEHFSSRLRSPADLEKLKNAFQAFHVYVIFYRRPQHELWLSAYSTAIINGQREALDDHYVNLESPYFNYLQLLEPWAQVFGRQNIIVRDYKNLINGDVCDDFLSLIGVPDISRFKRIRKANESLTPPSAEVIRRLNAFLPRCGETPYFIYALFIECRWLVHALVRLTTRHEPMPNLAMKSKIESTFARTNQKVTELYPNQIEPQRPQPKARPQSPRYNLEPSLSK